MSLYIHILIVNDIHLWPITRPGTYLARVRLHSLTREIYANGSALGFAYAHDLKKLLIYQLWMPQLLTSGFQLKNIISVGHQARSHTRCRPSSQIPHPLYDIYICDIGVVAVLCHAKNIVHTFACSTMPRQRKMNNTIFVSHILDNAMCVGRVQRDRLLRYGYYKCFTPRQHNGQPLK